MERLSERKSSWKWWVCALLLFASAINYMDRQTLANAATRITRELGLIQEQYGNLEWGFGWAFAVGSLFFGIVVDKFNVRNVYPIALLAWSATGFATGLVNGYDGLLICRTLLGFFEGAHWPCAVKTTRLLLDAKDRSMGNSVLQSGTSIGAVITPLIMRAMLSDQPGSWRLPFFVIGSFAVVWICLWYSLIKKDDLVVAPAAKGENAPGLWRILFSRRMAIIMIVVALINSSWQTIRAWLPKFLQEGRGYSEAHALYFNSVFYLATDVGVIGAGALTLWLVRKRAFTVTKSRLAAFALCALLSSVAVFLPTLQHGALLLIALLLIGAGNLGVFPIYHAFTQDLSREHQGKVTGVASLAAWALGPPAQKLFGRLIDRTKSFDEGLMVAGLLPMAAFVALWLFWPRNEEA
jgi:MFS transporter, ACS family, hexuronate transporter